VLETPVAVRAYTPRTRRTRPQHALPAPELLLVFDTETRTDHAQALLFGSYRVYTAAGKLRQEGLIAADDLSEPELAILRAYVATHAGENRVPLRLWSRSEFVRAVLWLIGYVARALIVGFNLPFDLSRLAWGWRPARNGGFTLQLWESTAADGRLWRDLYRPEITIKALDSKRQFTRFTTPARLDTKLRMEDGSAYRGRFLDLHTLVYAFTDKSLSLDRAAKAFGLEEAKGTVSEHGVLTPEYIDYNRQDVRLTWELYRALVAEWRRHPIDLSPEQGYSPAAVSKAYLRAMAVVPPSERRLILDDLRLGQATTAYFGGRTETRIRRVPLPVRVVDFTSMYPTVFALMGLWAWVTAGGFEAADATDDARTILATTSRASLHDPALWRRLAGVFCRVRPAGELLPVRAQYAGDATAASGSTAWTIGLNELVAEHDLWYTFADVVASTLLGGRPPTVLEAFRVVPVGRTSGLAPVRLRGEIAVDPAADDLFRFATEARARVKADRAPSKSERDWMAQFLKTFANGGAYGIFAEVRQLDPVAGGTLVNVHGLWPIEARVSTPEEAGAFCFPPLAATITGAARLLLALLQADVEARGGTYVACDTDSLLIVASEAGGLLPCPGGPERLPDGRPAVRALAWSEVDAVLAGLNDLNPYDRSTIPSLIKLEPQNFSVDDPSRPEELLCLATSSKRYVLYHDGPDGPVIRKPSVHGLGMFRSPLPRRETNNGHGDDGDRWPEWVEIVWQRIIAEAEGRGPAPEPDWFGLPAVSQLPISSPHVLRPFRAMIEGKPYAAQVKPFGFMLIGHVDPLCPLPDGLAAGKVTAVAPYTTDPAALLLQPWRNRLDGQRIEMTTRPGGEPGKVRLKTYGDIVNEYRLHPEAKSGDPGGGLGRRGSVGLLPRLRVRAEGLPRHIGKESNRLEEAENGLVNDPDDVYVEYRDERREWEAALPGLCRLREERGWRHLAEASGLSERALRYALNGGKVPHREARTELLRLAAEKRV
jgi:hypothetical protein